TVRALWPSRLPNCIVASIRRPIREQLMTALTTDIAKFVATVEPGRMPARASFGARIGMLDCVGTMIAGADEEAVKLVARLVPTSTSNDGAPEIPNGRNLSAPDA